MCVANVRRRKRNTKPFSGAFSGSKFCNFFLCFLQEEAQHQGFLWGFLGE
jgi:hypothetical protein